MNTRIRIVKHNANAAGENGLQLNQAGNSTNAQPAENKTRDIANTVNTWIAEFRDRKRNHRHSFSPLVLMIALTIAANAQTSTSNAQDKPPQQKQNSSAPNIQSQGATQVTIAVGRSIGVSNDLFKVGEAIVVTITMSNSSTEPQSVCLSGNLYQNLPVLTKNGEPVAISSWTSQVRKIAQHDKTCEAINLPERIVLTPKTQTVVDWFTLVDSSVPTGGDAWYNALEPGRYELSLQRRLDCCDGSTVQSNKITFTVAP